MGIRFISGRDFTDGESFSGAPVGVLNETAARALCGDTDCLGREVKAPKQPARNVIGVVNDVRESFRTTPRPVMFVPFEPSQFRSATVVIDADDTPANREGLKRALSTSPDALVQVRSLHDALEREVSPFRFNALVVGAFAALTLALAIVGVYSVMAAAVGERIREYGIRLALGASRGRVNRHVLQQACVPVGVGILAGLVLTTWSSRYISGLLYGVLPVDVSSFATASVVVLISGLAAAFVPARRAGRVDPIVVLRVD